MEKIPTIEDFLKIAPEEIIQLLNDCAKTPQSPTWHPEGDVLKHTIIVLNRARKTKNINYVLAALFHDLGKVKWTKPSSKTPGSWSSYGHEVESALIAKRHKEWIEEMGGNFDIVYEIVFNHMTIKFLDEMRLFKREKFKSHPYFPMIEEFSHFDNMKTLTKEEMNT
jgi:hypothetical protein